MKKLKVIVFICLLLVVIPFITSELQITVGDESSSSIPNIELKDNRPTNFSQVGVNNSLLWDGNAWSDDRWRLLTNHTFPSPVILSVGSVSAPSVNFGVSNTGLYSESGTIDFTVTGTQRASMVTSGLQMGSGTTGAKLNTEVATATNPNILPRANAPTYGMGYSGDGLHLISNGGTAITMDSSQNVGIGTTPSEKVHIVNNVNDGTYLQIDNSNTGAAAGSGFRILNDDSGLVNAFAHGTGYAGYLDGVPRADLGMLNFANFNANLIRVSNNVPLVFSQSGSEVMRINTGGNIGMGATSPAEKLHVKQAGTTRVLIEASTGDASNLKLKNTEGEHGTFVNGGEFHLYDYTDAKYVLSVDTNQNINIPNGNFEISAGNLNQTNGNATINNIYAEMWNKSSTGFQTIDLVTPEVYVPITNLTVDEINGFSNGYGNLTAQVTGLYSLTVHVGVESGQVSEYGIKAYINEVGSDNCYSHFHTTATVGANPSFTCYIRLAVGDVLNIRIDDHTNPVNDPTLLNMNVNLLRIGN